MAKDHNYNQDLENYKFLIKSRRGEFLYANPIHKRLEKLDKKQLRIFNYLLFKLYSQEIATLTHPALALSLDAELNTPLNWKKYLNSYGRKQKGITAAQFLESYETSNDVFTDELSLEEIYFIEKCELDDNFLNHIENKIIVQEASSEEIRKYELYRESRRIEEEIDLYEIAVEKNNLEPIEIVPHNLPLQLYTYFFIRQNFNSFTKEVFEIRKNFEEEGNQDLDYEKTTLKILKNNPLVTNSWVGKTLRDLLLPLNYFAKNASYFPEVFAKIFSTEELDTLALVPQLYDKVQTFTLLSTNLDSELEFDVNLNTEDKEVLRKLTSIIKTVEANFKITGLSLDNFKLLIDLHLCTLVEEPFNENPIKETIAKHLYYSCLDPQIPAKTIYQQIIAELIAKGFIINKQEALNDQFKVLSSIAQLDNFILIDLLSGYSLKSIIVKGINNLDLSKKKNQVLANLFTTDLDENIFQLTGNLEKLCIQRSYPLNTINQIYGEDLAASLQLAAYLSSPGGIFSTQLQYFGKDKEENEEVFNFFSNLPYNPELYRSSLDLYFSKKLPSAATLPLIHKFCYDYVALATYFNHYMHSNDKEELVKLAKILSLRAIYSLRNLLELESGKAIPYEKLKDQALINKELDLQWRLYRYASNYSENTKHKGKELNDALLLEHLAEIIQEEDPQQEILAYYQKVSSFFTQDSEEEKEDDLYHDRTLLREINKVNRQLQKEKYLLQGII